MIQEVFHVHEGLALSKATVLIEMTYGVDLEPVKELLPPVEHDVESLTPTQLAKMIGDTTSRTVNKAPSKNSKYTGYQPKRNTKVIPEIKNKVYSPT